MSDIRTTRISKKIPFALFAEKMGLDQTLLKKIERGFIIPEDSFFDKAAQVFNTSSDAMKKDHLDKIAKITPGEGYTTNKAEKQFKVFTREEQTDDSKINFVDLFCGAGGFSLGFESTGALQCTAGVDLLDDRIETFRANHKKATGIIGDLQAIDYDELWSYAENPDVIIGGPPCQGFSSIRPFRNLTENDRRNSLIEVYRDIVSRKKPVWFVLENVVGLLTHSNGKVIESLVSDFKSFGYNVSFKVLNAASFGVPQYRERLLIVGNRLGINFKWPKPVHYVDHKSMAGKNGMAQSHLPLLEDALLPPIDIMQAISDLPEITSGGKADHYNDNYESSYTKLMRNGNKVLTMHEATKHSEKMLEIIRLSGPNRSHLPEHLTSSGFSSCYSRLEADRPSVTITVNFVHPASNKCIHPFQHRALTPREGARLQSFPDDYVFKGSRSQIVKQIGNAVPPLLGKAIGEAILHNWGINAG